MSIFVARQGVVSQTGKSPVQVVGSTASTTNVGTIPGSAQSGDLLVAVNYRITTSPAGVPAGWTDIASEQTSSAIGMRAVWAIYDGVMSGPTFAASGNATTFVVAVRGASGIGASAAREGATNDGVVHWDALNTNVDDDTSLIIRSGGNSQTGTNPLPALANHTLLQESAMGGGTARGAIWTVDDRSDPVGTTLDFGSNFTASVQVELLAG